MSKNEVQTMEGAEIIEQGKTPLDKFKEQMKRAGPEFKSALPSHISLDKFQRTVMTAVMMNPDLLNGNRQSFLTAAVKCAGDGLLPDNREAAFVIFNTKDGKDDSGRDRWVKKIQYLPMTFGILKKVRQSGEVASVRVHVVYQIELDKKLFTYVLGDDERIEHTPYLGDEERGPLVAAYCIADLKDGTRVREVMNRADIEKVRRTSKSGNKEGEAIGIWKEWYDEMARKTVFRRASKWLPQLSEIIDNAFENDESMEILDQVSGTDAVIENHPGNAAQIEHDKTPQPDLNAEIEKSRAKDKDAVRVDGATEQPKNETKAADPATDQPKGETKKAEAAKFAKPATIIQAIKLSDTVVSVDECWEKDFAPDIKHLEATNPDEYGKVKFEYVARRKALAQ
jgi:phage RecT family recombinase